MVRKSGRSVADDGQERQVAFAGPGDLAAGEDADAVGVEEQTDHHGGIERRGAAGLVLVDGMDRGEIELGDDIEEEEDEVILRELGGRGVGLVGVEFGGPGTIGFAARGVHDRSRMRMGEINRVRVPHVKGVRAAKPSRPAESTGCFVDSLLGSMPGRRPGVAPG